MTQNSDTASCNGSTPGGTISMWHEKRSKILGLQLRLSNVTLIDHICIA